MELIRRRILKMGAVAFLLLTGSTAGAVEELHLTGILRNIDPKSNVATIEVISAQRHGVRRFKVDNPTAVASAQDKRIRFTIDATRCKANETCKIIRVLEVRK
jgi:hypothetical protein